MGSGGNKSSGLPKSNLAMVGGSIIDDKNSLPSKNSLMKKKTNPEIAANAEKAALDASKFKIFLF
jgi:hypothetical protein